MHRRQPVFALAGYSIKGPYLFTWTGRADPTIEADGPRDMEFLSFTPSVQKAQEDSNSTDYGLVTRRNVVFNIESDIGVLPQAIADCLRSS